MKRVNISSAGRMSELAWGH